MIMSKDESTRVIQACFEVYNEKGTGFLEDVYKECLKLEFGMQEIPFTHQVLLHITYKGQPLQRAFKMDFVCFDNILVEAKSVPRLEDEHRDVMRNHLQAAGYERGLLVNFGHYRALECERFYI